MFEITLLDADLLGDSDIRLLQAIHALERHLETKRDLETSRLFSPILRELVQQSNILSEVFQRAIDKDHPPTDGGTMMPMNLDHRDEPEVMKAKLQADLQGLVTTTQADFAKEVVAERYRELAERSRGKMADRNYTLRERRAFQVLVQAYEHERSFWSDIATALEHPERPLPGAPEPDAS